VIKLAEKLAILGGPKAFPCVIEPGRWPPVTKQDEEYVLASLHQKMHAWGPNCEALQQEWARWNGNQFCLATNSGTSALHMALAACGVGPGDEVITTGISWTSSMTCILHHNAIPVFVDVDWATMLLDTDAVEAAITPFTKAILPVHYWGLPCEMDRLMAIAAKHNLYVIEDACQAHGSLYKGRKTGTIGHASAFSLNQNKNLSGGEGGLFVTDDEALLSGARALMSFGEMRSRYEERNFDSFPMGWMYRPSDLAAAYGRSALSRLDETNAQTRANFVKLRNALEGTPGLVLPYDSPDQTSNGYAFAMRVDPAAAGDMPLSAFRDVVFNAIAAEGIPVGQPRWMLPSHAIIQAKRAYGKGCPWSCHAAGREVDYNLDQYPVSWQSVDSMIQLSVDSHRPPASEEELDALAYGIRKVFDQLDQIPMKGRD
jgi:dTDP-4-amino-4,6-dideoxygalactose transaminase